MAYNNVYNYDRNGNRTSVTRNGVASTYALGTNDEFYSGEGYTAPQTNYDADGNPGSITAATGNNITLTYDQDDEVTSMAQTIPTLTDHFLYDGDGNRVEAQLSSGNSYYVYDGSDIVEYIKNGSTQVYRLPGVGEYVGGQDYVLDDQLGSNTVEINHPFGLIGQFDYDSYGQEKDSAAPGNNTSVFRFAGKHGYVSDVDTGLVLCGSRYYLPILGRFMTQDPVGHEGGLNLYEYCQDNPLTRVDPSGHISLSFLGVLAPFFQTYSTVDSAAISAELFTVTHFDTTHREYGGWITGHDGRYHIQFPLGGSHTFLKSPAAFDYAGHYHTHPLTGQPIDDRGPGYENFVTGDPSTFSQADMNFSTHYDAPEYIYSAVGRMMKYQPRAGTPVQIFPFTEGFR